jgi:hypothetical protein
MVDCIAPPFVNSDRGAPPFFSMTGKKLLKSPAAPANVQYCMPDPENADNNKNSTQYQDQIKKNF